MRNTIIGLASLAIAGVALSGCSDQAAPEFAESAAMSDLYEIESGRIAVERGQSEAIRSFGQKMIDAHSETSGKLKQIVESEDIEVDLPNNLDASHRDMIEELEEAEAAEFDEEYAEQQVDAHQAAADIFEDYSEDGEDGALKDFAGETLPHIEEHLEEAKQLQDRADEMEESKEGGDQAPPAGDSMQ
ncbi:DUF4142 domain-containing protein [Methyloligella solikamskensis]|uniref:DUF4142 domain-containing protein n=1 Tax=Methyloligella solikamskensis TaxID=1177756 RepID=A0ABW3JAS8_9HYPH